MGEMADFYIAQEQDAYGWSPVGSAGGNSRPPRCNRCGSTDVRWRQQGGRWVLFSLTPGVEHTCPTSAEGFGDEPL